MTNLQLAKRKIAATMLASNMALTGAPIKIATGVTLGTAFTTTVVDANTTKPALAQTKESITWDGRTWKYYRYTDYGNNDWEVAYIDDNKDALIISNNLNRIEVATAAGIKLHIDDFNAKKTTNVTQNQTVVTPQTQVTTPSNQISTNSGFTPYVAKAQGTYDNKDVYNDLNYVRPDNSILTGTYLKKEDQMLLDKLNNYLKKETMTDAEVNDFLDIGVTLTGRTMDRIPRILILSNQLNTGKAFTTDGNSIITVYPETITKLKKSGGVGYGAITLDSLAHEILRFKDMNDKINYTKIKSRNDLIGLAEDIHIKRQTGFGKYLTKTTNIYATNKEDFLNYSPMFPRYVKDTFKDPEAQKYIIKDINDMLGNKITYDGQEFDVSIKGMFSEVGSELKPSILNRDEFIEDFSKAAKTVNNSHELENILDDYVFYMFNIYGNPAVFNNVDEKSKRTVDTINLYIESLKQVSKLNNVNGTDIKNYLKLSYLSGSIKADFVNNVEMKNIFSVAQISLSYSNNKTLEKNPYTQQEYDRDKVITTMAEVASKTNVNIDNELWSQLYCSELTKALNEKGIDITRIGDSVTKEEVKLKMQKLN